MLTVGEIAERLNKQAPSLVKQLLPNGHEAGANWKASGIDDTGQSASLNVWLSGDKCGRWRDYGNCRAGEEAGDMLDLLRLTRGITAAQAVAEAKVILGIEDQWTGGPARRDPAEERRRAEEVRKRAEAKQEKAEAHRKWKANKAKGLFLAGKPIAGTPAEAYLLGRGLTRDPFPDWPGALRFHGEVMNGIEQRKMPAMVSAIYNATGEQIGLHRTFLAQDLRGRWGKIPGDSAKIVLGNLLGGFIPISKGASGKPMRSMPLERVYVTEGIENGIVVRMMKPDARIVAAVCLPNIGELILPPPPKGERRSLVIICERDASPKAQDQLERSIARQQARGVEVFTVMPPKEINDLTDWLAELASGRKAG